MKNQNLPELIIQKSGVLTFPEINLNLDPQKLTPRLCRTALKIFKNAEERDVGTGYYWQYYKVIFGGYPTILSFCFYGTQCAMLDMHSSLPTDQFQDNWPTEESMQYMIQFFKKTFSKQFGAQLDFGSPYHVLDQRSYSAACGISYQKYVKQLRYSVEMNKKNDKITNSINISAIGYSFHITHSVLKGHVLVSDREEHFRHNSEKYLTEKECLEMVEKSIQKYKNLGYKLKKESGKAIAYDLVDPNEL